MANKCEYRYPSVNGKNEIFSLKWEADRPVAVLQIIHGMQEFVDRYDDFANYLNTKGYVVVGEDHLGHGFSVNNEEEYGYFGQTGSEDVLKDIHNLYEKTHKEYPDLPYFFLGHSMGSFLVRQYIERYGEEVDGVIIMGTGWTDQNTLTAGKTVCSIIGTFRGDKHRSKLVEGIAFGSYNDRCPKRTRVDWLTKDEKIVDTYLKEPRDTFRFTVNGYKFLFNAIEDEQKNIDKMPKDLPVFFVSGEEDPVGAYGKGVITSYTKFKEAGMTDVNIKLYPGDRHEILNELDRQQVYEDLYTWLENKRTITLGK